MPNKIAKSKKQIANSRTAKPVRKAATKAVRSSATRGSLSAPMYDAKGAKHGTFPLPKEIFGAKINEALMAQAVRVYLANQRIGTATVQTRGEVIGSTKKIYRQKGTGGARHGGKRAPIFVKGGVAHGPKPRDFSLSLPQKMKRAALLSALSLKASEGDIKVLSGLTKAPPKTKNMFQMIAKVTEDKSGKNRVLLVTSKDPKDLENVYRAGRNIKNVEILNARLLNTYEVLKHRSLLFMKESVEVLAGGSAKQSSKS